MEYDLLTDELLARLLHKGDERAFREIYRRYWKKLYHIALSKTHTAAVAEELVQVLFVSLWERRSVAIIHHLDSYLVLAMKYKVINYIKSFIAKEKCYSLAAGSSLMDESHTETQTLLHELSLAIQAAIEKLPVKTKAVFKLSREENRSVKEIALVMNLSEKAVEYHITQSLKLMRLHLKEFLVIDALICLHTLF